MDSQQARFILQSYRGDARDAADPHFAEALRQADADPALAAWLAEELERDEAVRRKLRAVPVPEGLRERILSQRPTGPVASARSYRSWLALAATVVLLAAVAAVWLGRDRRPVDFVHYRAQMIEIVQGPMRLDYRHLELAEVQRWLAEHQAPVPTAIPTALGQEPDVGCRQLMWNNRPVALVCFIGRGDRVVHLFAIRRVALPDAPDSAAPLFASVNGWSTATWTQDDIVYLLASRLEESALRKLL
ncbi:MAG TPA: hypothetical protein VNO52_06415 [Methylomirabilota bacterium]|nr:hypothetical protein [Methylomirabilota bacterium]